jgi:chemotaxis protein methyltransferase CheR
VNRDGINMVMDYVQEVTGVAIVNGRASVFKKKVAERQRELEIENPFSYFLYMKHRAPDTEVVELLDRLAVSETYFYREPEQFAVFREEILGGSLGSGSRHNRSMRILSAGCSTGEEPYTLAMIVCERLGLGPADADRAVKIIACDINTKSLRHARTARYDGWSIRHLPPELREKYMIESGGYWEVDDRIKRLVEFYPINLNDTRSWVCRADFSFNTVFCRNVLMYFSNDRARFLVNGLYDVLDPDGFLLTASTESVLRHTDRFAAERINDVLIYKKH